MTDKHKNPSTHNIMQGCEQSNRSIPGTHREKQETPSTCQCVSNRCACYLCSTRKAGSADDRYTQTQKIYLVMCPRQVCLLPLPNKNNRRLSGIDRHRRHTCRHDPERYVCYCNEAKASGRCQIQMVRAYRWIKTTTPSPPPPPPPPLSWPPSPHLSVPE